MKAYVYLRYVVITEWMFFNHEMKMKMLYLTAVDFWHIQTEQAYTYLKMFK